MISFEPSVMTLVFALLLLLGFIIIWRSVKQFDRDWADYHLHDLLMENGRASKAAHVMMASFSVTTWFFIYYTLAGKMTEAYFGLYIGAWIAPVVARLIKNDPATTVTTATATVTTESVDAPKAQATGQSGKSARQVR